MRRCYHHALFAFGISKKKQRVRALEEKMSGARKRIYLLAKSRNKSMIPVDPRLQTNSRSWIRMDPASKRWVDLGCTQLSRQSSICRFVIPYDLRSRSLESYPEIRLLDPPACLHAINERASAASDASSSVV